MFILLICTDKIVIQVVICILIAFFITVKPTSPNTKTRLGCSTFLLCWFYVYHEITFAHIKLKIDKLQSVENSQIN